MEKSFLQPKIVRKAADVAGSYRKLAKRINRSYRALLVYRSEGMAPTDIVSAIENIALETTLPLAASGDIRNEA